MNTIITRSGKAYDYHFAVIDTKVYSCDENGRLHYIVGNISAASTPEQIIDNYMTTR